MSEESAARMVDVTAKPPTQRTALVEARLRMHESTRTELFSGRLPKGDAIGVARVAGIMAAKRTADLIPLCHPLPLSAITVEIEPSQDGVRVLVMVRTTAATGVEMEAMCGASVAALTLYDMVKGIERGVEVSAVRLLSKQGGKSGDWVRE